MNLDKLIHLLQPLWPHLYPSQTLQYFPIKFPIELKLTILFSTFSNFHNIIEIVLLNKGIKLLYLQITTNNIIYH